MKKNQIKGRHIEAAIYGLLNIADYVTTKEILKNGGEELNPIARFLMKYKCFGIVKCFSTIATIGMMAEEDSSKSVNRSLIGLYSFVVLNNINVILRQRKNKQRCKK